MALQTIRHGARIDVATSDEVRNAVAAARAVATEGTRLFHIEKGVVSLDGTGAGNRSIDISPQYDWICERVTIQANPAAAALVLLSENQIQPTDLREVIQLGTVGMYSDG